MRVYKMSNEVNEALLEKLYEDALENLQKYKTLSDEEKHEIALETAEELFAEMSV
jgi:hypothetical protein